MPHTDKIIGRKSNVIMDQLNPISIIDQGDPLFDSEDERINDYFMEGFDITANKPPIRPPVAPSIYACQHYATTVPDFSIEVFSDKVKHILKDFLDNSNSSEACDRLKRLNCRLYHDHMVKLLIRTSLDMSSEDQRKTSSLLTLFVDGQLLGAAQLARGLEALMQRVDDTVIDVPHAATMIIRFVEWALEDNVVCTNMRLRISESFIRRLSTTDQERYSDVMANLARIKEQRVAYVGEILDGGKEGAAVLRESDADSLCLGHEFIRHLLLLSLEQTDVHRARASDSLNELYGVCFSADDIQLAFSRLLGAVEDLRLDNPGVFDCVTKFVLRALADEVVPPVFIKDNIRLSTGGASGRHVLHKVRGIVSRCSKSLAPRCRTLWSCSSEIRSQSFSDFKEICKMIVLEYFDSNDEEEVLRLLRAQGEDITGDLSFVKTSEFVRKVIQLAIEEDKRPPVVCDLLEFLVKEEELCREDLTLGLAEINKRLHDIKLDVPYACDAFEDIVHELKGMGLVSSKFTIH
eukprot:GHVR01076669.1.p1 GENE.GHVR01076669.1~~GHVR01076669.1.p1  ORF type:complete len:520 (+),score=105.22 GHVR01076669.1:51-1610(+)